MTTVPHISVLPIDVPSVSFGPDEFDLGKLPFLVGDSVYVEDVTDIIHKTNFIWTRYFSEAEIESLRSIRYALVHHFEARSEHLHMRPEDEKSKDLLYRLYLGLKIIRPTGARFQVFTFNMHDAVPRVPRWERNDQGTVLCDYEEGLIQWRDVSELAASASSILRVLGKPTSPVSQAIQSLEIGYRSEWLNVRHLLWSVGLDALFTSTEWKSRGREVAVDRICNFLGGRFKIYAEEPSPLGSMSLPDITVANVLDDMYKLRNDFAHGTWPDKKWAGKVCRRSKDGSRDIAYAEVLAEAASVCLRGCLRKILAEGQLVEMFSEKAQMNSHFASKGFVRRKKANLGAS